MEYSMSEVDGWKTFTSMNQVHGNQFKSINRYHPNPSVLACVYYKFAVKYPSYYIY